MSIVRFIRCRVSTPFILCIGKVKGRYVEKTTKDAIQRLVLLVELLCTADWISFSRYSTLLSTSEEPPLGFPLLNLPKGSQENGCFRRDRKGRPTTGAVLHSVMVPFGLGLEVKV